jgi:hypothetical protein
MTKVRAGSRLTTGYGAKAAGHDRRGKIALEPACQALQRHSTRAAVVAEVARGISQANQTTVGLRISRIQSSQGLLQTSLGLRKQLDTKPRVDTLGLSLSLAILQLLTATGQLRVRFQEGPLKSSGVDRRHAVLRQGHFEGRRRKAQLLRRSYGRHRGVRLKLLKSGLQLEQLLILFILPGLAVRDFLLQAKNLLIFPFLASLGVRDLLLQAKDFLVFFSLASLSINDHLLELRRRFLNGPLGELQFLHLRLQVPHPVEP